MSSKTSQDQLRSASEGAPAFALPPIADKPDGTPRRVGFEFEYAGLGVEDSAKMLQRLFGGSIEPRNAFALEVRDTAVGDFTTEIDLALLADEKLEGYLAELGIDVGEHVRLKHSVESLLARLTRDVVPCEIAMPPLPVSDLSAAERVAQALRESHARGTRSSLLNAFGLHINTDLARTDPAYLLAHIRALLVLFDWICAEYRVDLTRRALAFIRQYPKPYEERILDPGYAPGLDRLIDDYLDLVGSRDYALDMLPAFAHLDHDRVMARAKAPSLVKARPAFHYRLANSRVDEAGWRVADEWRHWVRIEEVAADARLLEELCAARRKYLASPAPGRGAWADRVRDILGA